MADGCCLNQSMNQAVGVFGCRSKDKERESTWFVNLGNPVRGSADQMNANARLRGHESLCQNGMTNVG